MKRKRITARTKRAKKTAYAKRLAVIGAVGNKLMDKMLANSTPLKGTKYKYKISTPLPETQWRAVSTSVSPKALTQERGKTHGDWIQQSRTAQCLKRVIRDSHNYHVGSLSDSHLDAIEMILVKISRICTGDPKAEDHWNDIQGYAELGKGKSRRECEECGYDDTVETPSGYKCNTCGFVSK